MGFRETFIPDRPVTVDRSSCYQVPSDFSRGATGLGEFVRDFGGVSFNQGLYRVHKDSDIPHWTAVIEEVFPKYKGQVLGFSYDWLGNHFALDRAREEDGEFQILMFEPGTGEVLEIPTSFREFHDTELVEYQNEALAAQFYESWLASGGKVPGLKLCVGYKTPLFLGGRDVADNLELSDMEVYWSFCGQLLDRIRSLPNGSRVGGIDIG